jgi:uncharacterized phage-associated protein
MISQELDKVQRSIITIHRDLFGESPSPMKLQKLCYYAQAYALAEKRSLFSEDFRAWQHGPVIHELYNKYKDYKWHPINDEDLGEPDDINFEHLCDIVSAYGRYDGAALSTMTHREKPWLEARGDLEELAGSDALISKESLADYFSSKLRVNG